MGLLEREDKPPCPVCDGEVTGLFTVKIGGGQEICMECASKISMQKNILKNADVSFVQKHLAFRKEQAVLYAGMSISHRFNFPSSIWVAADEEKQLLAIGNSDMNAWNDDPIVLRYDQLTGYELWLENKKTDDDTTPRETFSVTGTAAVGCFAGNGGKEQYFTLKLKTTDPYWPEMNILAAVPGNMEFTGYNNNMSGLVWLLKCIVRKEPL
ncbi:MAG TPA: hypothetical protein VN608_07715 [Clostridia bacterium]|nr:hypothetical protein [Clostridia bacterium]